VKPGVLFTKIKHRIKDSRLGFSRPALARSKFINRHRRLDRWMRGVQGGRGNRIAPSRLVRLSDNRSTDDLRIVARYLVLPLARHAPRHGAARSSGTPGWLSGTLASRPRRVAPRVRRRCSGQPMGMNLRDARRRVSS